MAEINLEIAGEPGRISANALKLGIQQTVGLLHEYAAAMADKQFGHVRWNVRNLSSNGTLRVGFSSMLVHGTRRNLLDNSQSVASSLVGGIDTIDREARTPPYISEVGIRRVEGFVSLIKRNEAKSFTLDYQGLKASVTNKTGENLAKLIEIKRKAVGSVEGRLVRIDVARSPKFSIIHYRTKKSITCEADDGAIELAKKALGQRVVVYGTLYKNINGDTIRVGMRNMYVFSASDMRARLMEISSLPIPSFANQLDTDDYLIGSRGE